MQIANGRSTNYGKQATKSMFGKQFASPGEILFILILSQTAIPSRLNIGTPLNVSTKLI